MYGQGAGLLAGAMLALYPLAIFFDGFLQKSSLDLFLVVLLLALLGEFMAGGSAFDSAQAGEDPPYTRSCAVRV